MLRVLPLLVLAFRPLEGAGVQHHGLEFESWVRQTFFPSAETAGPTQKWDIPASANTRHGGIPVNPKAARFGTAVGLGDALRQFDIDEPFLLVVGYWTQEGDAKRFVKVIAPRVDPGTWRALWGPVTRADLERLDALIKDRSRPHGEVQRAAQEMKRRAPFTGATFILNPKIDGKGQRRLQCSLAYADLLRHFAPGTDPEAEADPRLFGQPIPLLEHSPPRTFPDG